MNQDNIFAFIDAVSDANLALIRFENGERHERNEVIRAWERVLVCLDTLEDTEENRRTRENALQVLESLSDE